MEQRFTIVKNIKGNLALRMPSHNYSSQDISFIIKDKVKSRPIPATYALGIFIDPVLETMYKKGYFSIEPEAEFRNLSAKNFYVIESKKQYSGKEITECLLSQNIEKINKIIESGNFAKKQVLINAKEIIDQLNNNTINFLEEKYQVELTIEK